MCHPIIQSSNNHNNRNMSQGHRLSEHVFRLFEDGVDNFKPVVIQYFIISLLNQPPTADFPLWQV
jgi:hypothetical protein